jgi:hypothetical protein
MTIAYPKLFEPINIGKVTIKNRIAMAPMGIIGLTASDGNPGPRAIDYYIERARGGTGLIITGVFKVENEIESNVHNMHIINRASVALLANYPKRSGLGARFCSTNSWIRPGCSSADIEDPSGFSFGCS